MGKFVLARLTSCVEMLFVLEETIELLQFVGTNVNDLFSTHKKVIRIKIRNVLTLTKRLDNTNYIHSFELLVTKRADEIFPWG